MLNISNNSVSSKIDRNAYSTLKEVEAKVTKRLLVRLIKWSVFILFIVSILPWTQNVRSSGVITTLNPEQRPQEIHSVISGRIESWKVKEGDFVEKGDTIAIISEIKDDYFDEDLLMRTMNQLNLKKRSVNSYEQKIGAQDTQLLAALEQRNLESNKLRIKMEQTVLKIQNDSIAYQAAVLDNSVAQYQYQRTDSLYKTGLKSLVDLETRKLKAQQSASKEIAARNYWLNNQNELINLKIELNNIASKFTSIYAKTLSEKMSTETNKFDTESNINKLENQYSNYEVRQGFHFITAPQDGFITKLLVHGIGEIIKEGAAILSFMPKIHSLAVEIYVDPIDLPLMNANEHVRLQFDGWPAIVFSGWPGASYGTYGGRIYAIDKFISANGKYRMLVRPDENDHPWPEALRVGSGTKAMILLNDVPIYYEIWRQINGFPPNFYKPTDESKSEEKSEKK
ncbi:MAG: multidrug resistance efflux pump [Crocinitomicaceae bacterium]|jgi:adhesin transport system membrane fusion protein